MTERIFPTDRHGNPLGPARDEVVRCRDCKHYKKLSDGNGVCHLLGIVFAEMDDGFCAWASRGESNARP